MPFRKAQMAMGASPFQLNCGEDTFPCGTLCLPRKRVCDGVADCKDRADERDCASETETPALESDTTAEMAQTTTEMGLPAVGLPLLICCTVYWSYLLLITTSVDVFILFIFYFIPFLVSCSM